MMGKSETLKVVEPIDSNVRTLNMPVITLQFSSFFLKIEKKKKKYATISEMSNICPHYQAIKFHLETA